jgi:hypothetical protein
MWERFLTAKSNAAAGRKPLPQDKSFSPSTYLVRPFTKYGDLNEL